MMADSDMRRSSNLWQRDRIVAGILCGSVVAKKNFAWGGGSSSVLSRALNDCPVRPCTSSMMYILNLPDGMYFTSLKQTDALVSLEGVAQSNERVSEFLRNLKDSPLFAAQPKLEQTLVQEIALSNKSKHQAYNFKMVLTLKKPENPEAKKGAAGKPAKAPAN